MKQKLHITIFLLLISSLFGSKLVLVKTKQEMAKIKNSKVDNSLYDFWLENGDFNKLPKRTIEFSKIDQKHANERVVINGAILHKGSAVHSDRNSFTDNELVDIYTMFNVIYSVQSHSDHFIVDPVTMYAMNPEPSIDGSGYHKIFIKDEYYPDIKLENENVDSGHLNIYLWSSVGISAASLIYWGMAYDQYSSAQTSAEASAFKHKSQISGKVFGISLSATTALAIIQWYKKKPRK